MGSSKKAGEQDAETPVPIPETVVRHPAWLRLDDQLHWYDEQSVRSQRLYKGLKVAQVSLAVLIPAMSLLPVDYARWSTALAGVTIAVLEAVQQMNQYSTLWVTYRSTAESLKHEKFLFLSEAGPYRGLPMPDRLMHLAERVEEHVSAEHANWFNETQRAISKLKKEGT